MWLLIEKAQKEQPKPLLLPGSLPDGKNAGVVLSTSAKNNQQAAGGRGPGEGEKISLLRLPEQRGCGT